MYYFYPTKGTYTMCSAKLSNVIAFMRNHGGNREQWALYVKHNDGMDNIPILDTWFD